MTAVFSHFLHTHTQNDKKIIWSRLLLAWVRRWRESVASEKTPAKQDQETEEDSNGNWGELSKSQFRNLNLLFQLTRLVRTWVLGVGTSGCMGVMACLKYLSISAINWFDLFRRTLDGRNTLTTSSLMMSRHNQTSSCSRWLRTGKSCSPAKKKTSSLVRFSKCWWWHHKLLNKNMFGLFIFLNALNWSHVWICQKIKNLMVKT